MAELDVREEQIQSIQNLNTNLANLSMLYHQVKKHAWLTAAAPEPVHEFLADWSQALLRNADLVAVRLVALGGCPTAGPCGQQVLASILVEQEGIFSVRAMLEKDLRDSVRIIHTLQYHLAQPAAAEDLETAQILRELLHQFEQRQIRLEKFLSREI